MKRSWTTMRSGPDEESQEVGLALASLYSSETLRAVLDVLSACERFGGEAYIGSYRAKFDAENHRVEPDQVGEWETIALMFHYEHVAKRTRTATEAPEEAEESIPLSQPVPIANGQGAEEHVPEPEAA